MIPSSAKSTAQGSNLRSGRLSRRRLFCLGATAAAASSLGIALGSTLRFQVVPTGQAPLFQPKQDFPPLAEWPPQTPEREDLDTDWIDTEWDAAPPSPQLVYRDDIEEPEYEYYESISETADETAASSSLESNVSEPPVADWQPETASQESAVEEIDDETASPLSATVNGDGLSAKFKDSAIAVPESVTDQNPWFYKQPASESQLLDTPTIAAPDQLPSSFEDLRD